ncbi:hypothetical protein KDL01_20950 [Actinospica durhamensis]|uniref:Uncharacterized protein n=1 Tax=Actinospica durhamensis TaxID=1508375 RepID=A0A941IQ21_9ACTN|nr:hypothetical protein [Actinospica durhamensis]MBR7835754.1 hypothetical protein [Actinospica durhamensis]
MTNQVPTEPNSWAPVEVGDCRTTYDNLPAIPSISDPSGFVISHVVSELPGPQYDSCSDPSAPLVKTCSTPSAGVMSEAMPVTGVPMSATCHVVRLFPLPQ